MSRRLLFIIFLFLLLSSLLSSLGLQPAEAVSWLGEHTLVLYDASSGEIPSSSLVGFTAFHPDGASLGYEDGSAVLDTTASGSDTYAGWVAGAATTDGFPILDSTAGFQANFTLQVEREAHDNNNRSGLSIIILDNNAKGIELAFWANEIWAQSDDSTGGLFRHGEGVAFDTAAALIDYQLTMIGDTYTLTANSQPILTGPVRDYSAFDRFPDPYETPNFLFLGDDTTSAQARVRLRFLSVTGAEPVAPTSAVISTSTSLAQPTLTSTPILSVTSNPSPTPTRVNPVSNLCPSGWLIAVLLVGSSAITNKFRRRLGL